MLLCVEIFDGRITGAKAEKLLAKHFLPRERKARTKIFVKGLFADQYDYHKGQIEAFFEKEKISGRFFFSQDIKSYYFN